MLSPFSCGTELVLASGLVQFNWWFKRKVVFLQGPCCTSMLAGGRVFLGIWLLEVRSKSMFHFWQLHGCQVWSIVFLVRKQCSPTNICHRTFPYPQLRLHQSLFSHLFWSFQTRRVSGLSGCLGGFSRKSFPQAKGCSLQLLRSSHASRGREVPQLHTGRVPGERCSQPTIPKTTTLQIPNTGPPPGRQRDLVKCSPNMTLLVMVLHILEHRELEGEKIFMRSLGRLFFNSKCCAVLLEVSR